MSVVTLLTDFGTADTYVAEIKGAVLQIAPGATLVDVTHEIALGDVAAAAYALGRMWPQFPPGTVHLVVVDPGVGSDRRALVVEAAAHRFVAPDNGLLSSALEQRGAKAFSLPIPPDASPTFHGRDVFAPAAGRLATGAVAAGLGEPVTDPVRLPRPVLTRKKGDLVGQVVHVDRFGTLVTNLPAAKIGPRAIVRIGVYELPLRRTFADVGSGEPLAFVGSGGTIEIGIRDGRADNVLGATRGAEVRATARPTEHPAPRASRITLSG